jgi:Ca2+-binding EF-hand superfamily protein
MDTNGDGSLTISELCRGIESLVGKRLSKGRLQELMQALDDDGDGEVSLVEFAKIFQRAGRAQVRTQARAVLVQRVCTAASRE